MAAFEVSTEGLINSEWRKHPGTRGRRRAAA